MHDWVHQAIKKIEADRQRSSDTHLFKVPLPAIDGIDLYLKDESTHPTGSLKHRLARSLILYGLCNGAIKQNTTVIEASSGSTAISEAYFARLLGLNFIAVIPAHTSCEKIKEIEFYGGRCHTVSDVSIYEAAENLAKQPDHFYIDQFTNAERATDWRGNNNIAESIFKQMALEPHPIPEWIVVGAGTGGTSATIGRFLRYQRHNSKLCVADPQNSVFFDYFHTKNSSLTSAKSSNIEGIGRPRVEPSFIADVIDHMIRVPDAASYACIQFLEQHINKRCGGSTGTNLIAAFELISQMQQQGKRGSIVSMICDGGDRYANTYYNEAWLKEKGFSEDLKHYKKVIEHFSKTSEWLPSQQ